jgi:hypothetical protein
MEIVGVGSLDEFERGRDCYICISIEGFADLDVRKSGTGVWAICFP